MISGTLSLPLTHSPPIVFVTEATIFIIFIASLIFSPLDIACPNVTFNQLTTDEILNGCEGSAPTTRLEPWPDLHIPRQETRRVFPEKHDQLEREGKKVKRIWYQELLNRKDEPENPTTKPIVNESHLLVQVSQFFSDLLLKRQPRSPDIWGVSRNKDFTPLRIINTLGDTVEDGILTT